VIDVLRATTTAAVLCHRVGELRVVRTPGELVHLPERPDGYALFSELSGVASEIPRFDNSPVLARDADLSGRMPVLVTTNGTLAIGLAVEFAQEVVLAGFVNLACVADHVVRRGAASVAVMPAGDVRKAQRHAEDDACAESLVARLAGTGARDLARAIAACRTEPRILERCARTPALAADIEVCFDLDAVPVVPRVARGAAGEHWFGVTPASS